MSYHISITGHRPGRLQGGYNLEHPLHISLFKEIYDILEFFVGSKQHVTLHTGMALGVDTVFALAGIQLKQRYPNQVKLVAEIPCLGQERMWSTQDQSLYREILTFMDDKTIYQQKYTKSCMFERNRGMVKASDLVLAVYDDSGKGGTHHAVEEARRLGKDLYLFNASVYIKE